MNLATPRSPSRAKLWKDHRSIATLHEASGVNQAFGIQLLARTLGLKYVWYDVLKRDEVDQGKVAVQDFLEFFSLQISYSRNEKHGQLQNVLITAYTSQDSGSSRHVSKVLGAIDLLVPNPRMRHLGAFCATAVKLCMGE
jgi:hypothetical protein